MKKLLAITMIFVMLMAASSFATKTRVLTMGDNNMVLLDEANIFIFPSRLYQYPDMAVAEISSSPFISVSSGNGFSYGEVAEFGVHWKFGTEKPWVLGTYLFNSDGQTDEAAFIGEMLPLGLTTEFQEILSLGSSNWGEQPNLPFFEIEQSNRRLGLVYSRELGGNLFGFGFDYLHSSCKDEDVDVDDNLFVDEEETFARYKFSFGLTEAAGMWDVAAHVSFVSWTDTEYDFGEDAEYDETKPDGNMTLAAKGRYFHQYNPTITFVPHVGVAYSKFGTEAYDGADDTEPEISVGVKGGPAGKRGKAGADNTLEDDSSDSAADAEWS